MQKTTILNLNNDQLETIVAAGGNGQGDLHKKPKCPEITTLACGEEANGCSGC